MSSSLPSLYCFFLCLLGNLAVVMRRSVAGDTRSGEECAKRAVRKGRGYSPERDLDAIFKSSATSILSLLSPGLSRCLRSSARDPSRPRSVGYRNTALNRPPQSDLNLGSSPHSTEASPHLVPSIPEFSFDVPMYGEF